MIWIKRNLFFVLGSLAALVLTLLAGWYLYGQWNRNNAISEELKVQYGELDHLMSKQPSPGYPGKVDNLALALQQRSQLQEWTEKIRSHNFKPVASPVRVISSEGLSKAMSRVLAQLRSQAREANVHLPQPNWPFGFSVQEKPLDYKLEGISPVATQLGEVQAVCDILFRAGINSMESIQREPVSPEDQSGPATDYLQNGVRTITNELAAFSDGKPLQILLTPYQVGFRSSSSELAAVVAGFANSPNVFAIRSISVEQLASPPPVVEVAPPPPPPVAPVVPATPPPGFFPRPGQPWTPPQPAPVTPAVTNLPVYKPGTKGGLPVVLDEKQLQTTMVVVLIKPL